MDREQIKQALVDYGWDAAERERVLAVLRAYEADPVCRAEMLELDRVRAALRPAPDAAEPDGGWAGLAERLHAALAPRPRRRRAAWNALAAAAVLVAAVIWRAAWLPRAGPVPESAAAALAPFSAADVARYALAFRQIADVYDQRPSWMVLGENVADLGLDRAADAPASRLLFVRLALTCDGRPVSSADLMIVPGQDAEVGLPAAAGPELRYHLATSADEPPRLALWAELVEPGARRTLATLATELCARPGQTLKIGGIVTSGGQYALHAAFAEAPPGAEPR